MSKTNSTLENSSINLAIVSAVLDLRENLNLTLGNYQSNRMFPLP